MSFDDLEHRLLDMLLAARRVQEYVQNKTLRDFESNGLLQDAVTHQIQTIGEAASWIPSEFQQAHPEIPWNEIVGMRHRLVHDYRRVEMRRVWDAAKNSVPQLISALDPLIPPPPAD